jgi:hypothetical protein
VLHKKSWFVNFTNCLSASAANAANPAHYALASIEGSRATVAAYGASVALGVHVLNGPSAGGPNQRMPAAHSPGNRQLREV